MSDVVKTEKKTFFFGPTLNLEAKRLLLPVPISPEFAELLKARDQLDALIQRHDEEQLRSWMKQLDEEFMKGAP